MVSFCLGGVVREAKRAAALLCDLGRNGGGIHDVADDDRGALGGESSRVCGPDALRRSCDDRDLVQQTCHLCSHFWVATTAIGFTQFVRVSGELVRRTLVCSLPRKGGGNPQTTKRANCVNPIAVIGMES